MKQLPWLSLVLLAAAYSTFSWFVYHAIAPWLVWTFVLGLALAQALLLTTFFQGFRSFWAIWLRSDVGYFTVVLVSSIFTVFALVWIRIFGQILVLVAAEVLARLDLQNAGFNRSQALFILTVASLIGLAIGWGTSQTVDLLELSRGH